MRKLKLLIAACALMGVTSMQAKTDVTATYLKDANLASLTGWGNPERTDWKTDGAVNVVEFWNWSREFTFQQEVTMPAGYYRLAVNAFYRNGGSGDGTNNNMAWIFAGEQQKNVVALTAMSELSGYAGSNDLYRAATAFSQGKYSNEFDFDLSAETTIKIGFKGTCPNSGWCILGPVTLFEYTAEDYIADYRAKVTEAEALYNTPMWAADLAALHAAVVDESTLTTVDDVKSAVNTLSNAINAANTSIITYAAAIAPFNKIKAQADAIAAVEYTETTAGSHDTFTAAIAAQQTAATSAANADAITAAITALKDAVKAYLNAAEPKNDGEYFDVTCLMNNPDFDDNNITGWTKESTLNPNTRIQCNEFYGSAAFDFYQTVTGLPNGSFTLSMKAFQRPGWYDGVYADYSNGINNATAKIYVNSDESDVMNIMAEMNSTRIYTDPAGENAFNSDKQPQNAPGFIPNSMEGAAAWFAQGKYQTEVAALVEDGTLRLGFKDEAHSSDVWTLFDEFRLHYYGSSKMIYYKQQLPQIKAAANADLSNALYANVTGKEKSDFQTAIAATPAEETEAAYKAVIDEIVAKQTAFRAAVTSYDALVAAKAYTALTEITANIGTGVFQYPASITDKWTVYSNAKDAVDNYTVTETSTAADIQTVVDALDAAIADYNDITLNAPAADKRYYLNIVDGGQPWDGYAITFKAGDRGDDGLYNTKYEAPANVNLNQALKFTAVEGEANTYKVSGIRVENGGEQYLTTKLLAYGNGSHGQLRTTEDATKAMRIKIQPTTTDGQFKLLNVEANAVIARNASNPDNGVYTDGDANFTIAEAAQASIAINTSAAGYGTTILPFAAEIPTGVKAYTCEAYEGELLTLVEATAIEANKPYIIEGAWKETKEGWGSGAALENKVGLLTGVYAETDAPVGSYVMQKHDTKVGFFKVADGKQPKVGANHCYVTASASPARAFFFSTEATGIKAIESLTSGEAQIFNTNGAQLPALQKGINIIRKSNGESYKVMVK